MFGSRSFSLGQARQLGCDLAQFLAGSLSPSLVSQRRHVLSANRVTRLLEQAYGRAREHKQKHGLGFLGRTVAAKHFKAALEQAGYPKDFVDVAVEGLIVELSRRAPPSPRG